MRINLNSSLLLLLLVTFYSCEAPRFVHTPTALNNTFFSGKNDSKLAAYTSGNSVSGDGGPLRNRGNGFDLMGAFAVSNHFAFTGSYHKRTERNYYLPYRYGPFDTSLVNYKRNEWETGLGYFAPLNKAKTLTANFYAGIGKGTYLINDVGNIKDEKYSRFHNANPFKIYFQPSFNFIFPSARIGAVCRVNVIKYQNVITDYTNDELLSFHLDDLNNKTLVFAELGLNVEIKNPKWPWVAVEAELSVNFNDDNYYRARTLNASAGFVFEPVNLFRRRSK